MNQGERDKAMTLLPHQTAYVYRLRFSRGGSLSYIGHLDLMRTFERTFRRANLPLLHSRGYNPRPMMVFALPLGVGIATTDDYIDVSLSEPRDIQEVITVAQKYLPHGLAILDGWTVPETNGSIMAIVEAAGYSLTAPGIVAAIQEALKMDELMVEKRSKGKMIMADIRPLIIGFDPAVQGRIDNPDQADVLVYAGSSRNLRPDLLLSALVKYVNYPPLAAANCDVVRTGLFAGSYPDLKRFKEMR